MVNRAATPFPGKRPQRRGAQRGPSRPVQLRNWNDPAPDGELDAGLQCIDGLQRINAVAALFKGEVQQFGLTVNDLNQSRYSMRGLLALASGARQIRGV